MHRKIGNRGAGQMTLTADSRLGSRGRIDAPHSNPCGEGPSIFDSDEGYSAFAESLRLELEPGNVLEETLIDRIILAAWDLRRLSSAVIRGGVVSGSARRDESKAERSLIRCLDALARLRAGALSTWGRPAPATTGAMDEVEDEPVTAAEDVEMRPRSRDLGGEDFSEPGPAEDPTDSRHLWTDRLVFDANVSTDSPVVRGTWVTVGHVVTLVVDGWTWADILRTHPELTEDDLRACLTYAVEEENSSLPIDEG